MKKKLMFKTEADEVVRTAQKNKKERMEVC